MKLIKWIIKLTKWTVYIFIGGFALLFFAAGVHSYFTPPPEVGTPERIVYDLRQQERALAKQLKLEQENAQAVIREKENAIREKALEAERALERAEKAEQAAIAKKENAIKEKALEAERALEMAEKAEKAAADKRFKDKAQALRDRNYKDTVWASRGEESVKALLRDPSSATFRGKFVSRKSGHPIVCGYVNARNAFGGYTGFQAFVSGVVSGTTFIESQTDDFQIVWNKFCR